MPDARPSAEKGSAQSQPQVAGTPAPRPERPAPSAPGFTPGPWEVHDDLEHPLHLIWWREIAEELGGPGILVARTCFAPSSLANAQLIAAAPDLYEALLRVWDDIDDETMPATAEIIRAALAKAEGR